jgi:hypothetical protein
MLLRVPFREMCSGVLSNWVSPAARQQTSGGPISSLLFAEQWPVQDRIPWPKISSLWERTGLAQVPGYMTTRMSTGLLDPEVEGPQTEPWVVERIRSMWPLNFGRL